MRGINASWSPTTWSILLFCSFCRPFCILSHFAYFASVLAFCFQIAKMTFLVLTRCWIKVEDGAQLVLFLPFPLEANIIAFFVLELQVELSHLYTPSFSPSNLLPVLSHWCALAYPWFSLILILTFFGTIESEGRFSFHDLS